MGSFTVTAADATPGGLSDASDSIDVTPVDADVLTIAAIASQPYTGAAIEPAVSVSDGEMQLELGLDYTVSYNDNVDVGTASVTVTGLGNYTGTKTASFEITFAMPPQGPRVASGGSLLVVLFDSVGGADRYEYLLSPSDAGWLPQSDSDRGSGATPNPFLRLPGSEVSAGVEVFIRAIAGDVVSDVLGPLLIPAGSEDPQPVTLEGLLPEDATVEVAPVLGGLELRFDYVVKNEVERPLPNLWITIPALEGAAVRLVLPDDAPGRLYSFDSLPNHWYWEGIGLAPAPDGSARFGVVVVLEVE